MGLPDLSRLGTASKVNQTPCLTRQAGGIFLVLSLESEKAEAIKTDYSLLNRNNQNAVCKLPCNQRPLEPTKGSRNRLVSATEPSLGLRLGSAWQQPHSQLLFMTKAKLSYALLNSTENKLLEAQGRGDRTPNHITASFSVFKFHLPGSFTCIKNRV